MNLSKQIIRLRKDKHVTQEELAEKIYVSRQTISNWEREKSYPDIDNLLLLSVYFDVSLDYLVKGDVEMLKNIKDVEGYKKIMFIRNIVLNISVFLMILGRYPFGDSFSIFVGLVAFLVLIVSQLMMTKIEKRNEIDNSLLNHKEADEILFFLENKELQKEEFERKRKREIEKGKRKWLIRNIIAVVFIFLTAFIARILF